MKKLYKVLTLIICAIVIYSCSTKKDTVINRNFHVLNTKYNVLFNGEQAFEKGIKNIEDNYTDNFWKRLPLEPIKFDERNIGELRLGTPGNGFDNKEDQKNKPATPFDRAEEKAVKAIQKHSMNIGGYEKNRQIDDAYLLLGKSRYYTQRFIPAIEAFNYIIANYPKADLIYDTKVWRAKANVRLENEKLAIETLKLLVDLDKNEEDLSGVQLQSAHTALAMAYEKTDTIQKVIDNLKKSVGLANNEQSYRNKFVLGQIYSELNRKDSSRTIFKLLAGNKKTPRKYRIHAYIELVKNLEKDSSNLGLIGKFKKLIRNSDNRKYHNELYYHLGVLEEKRDSIETATDYYIKSLEAKKNNNYQKTYAYERLGNIYFDKQEYLLAGSFYDSVLQATSEEFENEKRIRRIKRKQKGLNKLRSFEEVVKTNDSILKLTKMSSEEQTAFFEQYIEKLKEDEEKKRQRLANSQNFGNQLASGSSFGGNKGKWYFYNSQSKGFGKVSFTKVWGDRPLEDNWRWSDKTAPSEESEENEETKKQDNSRYEVATYVKTIPTNKEEIKALAKDRNEALYQLGLIYKEQFKNPDLAIEKFEYLLTVNEKPELKLPINYHLYQLYERISEKEKSEEKKNLILTKYADSKFAQIIREPNTKLSTDDEVSEIDKKYKNIYSMYKFNMNEEAVNQIDNLGSEIENSELIAKFALLRALCIGRYKSKEEYKKALEFVAFKYANQIEGQKANEIIQLLK
ncbi:type IX secretion system periplasmic lipoprotein PorW/SprE [Tenacibaculum jejuense]|uniref:SprE lipoprotein n=1 Tax=Tenacibaculum jejuense TaxID=584609 RepID=A0A238U4N1_9FLAO|nr:tetratricopeptide repeat protein [Tenacibaculum jejuense]SNR13986.1 SprE lipoprotein precursor [Tenacibaculum jejuense]